VPWIVLSVPFQVFLGFGILIVLLIVAVGEVGMFAKTRRLTTAASLALLVVLLAGKVGIDLAHASAPDTAVLLVQFVLVIFLFEASRVVLSFDKESSELSSRTDEESRDVLNRLEKWVSGQLAWLARFSIGALGLSLVLLVLGGLTSFSIDQVAFSAVLVLLVVGALVFLITQRREPETREASLS
jgi:hypothetical protein